ncbi:MAG TPA: HEAT repeat domain-containing protein, partial [Lacunisphaera sp.]|nr:HEAT repeat domain-containing protein [Lacunisphaera sp.]
GKLYYSDWAEGWPKSKKGRIYTIFDPARANDTLVKSTQQLIASDWTKRSDAELAKLLAHADWRVRLEAQYTLAERGEKSIAVLNGIATQAGGGLAALHAVWGLGQLGHKNPQAVEVLRPLLAHANAETRAQAAKTLGDLHDAGSAETLVTLLGDSAPRVKFFAAQALGRVKHPAATAALLAAARANDNADHYLRHALVLGLVNCATPEQLAALASDDSAAVRLAGVLALRRLQSPLIVAFLSDRDAAVSRETAIAINDAPIPAAYPALAALAGKGGSSEAVQLRALNALFRLGTPEQAAALAAFAARGGSAALRTEALELLALWPAPPARDRIVGVYLPLADKTRPAGVAAAAFSPLIEKLFGASSPDSVQLAALEAISALGLKDTAAVLAAVVADQAQSGSVRSAALKTLDEFNVPELAASAAAAAASNSPELRLAALPIQSRLQPGAALAHLRDLIERGTAKEQQTAFQSLANTKGSAADDILLEQLARLETGQVARAAQLDLLEAAAKRNDPRIAKALADREAALAASPDPLAPFRVTLEGGNARRAGRIVLSNPVVQCIRCHRIGDIGAGDAGPNLAGIGARESREYLLESLIKPSARIAPGFEIVSVTKKNGEAVFGTLVSRDGQRVQLKVGDDQVEIPTADIKTVESAPSGMPEVVGLVLTKSEIRDVVEYLANLKEPYVPREKAPLRAFQQLNRP